MCKFMMENGGNMLSALSPKSSLNVSNVNPMGLAGLQQYDPQTMQQQQQQATMQMHQQMQLQQQQLQQQQQQLQQQQLQQRSMTPPMLPQQPQQQQQQQPQQQQPQPNFLGGPAPPPGNIPIQGGVAGNGKKDLDLLRLLKGGSGGGDVGKMNVPQNGMPMSQMQPQMQPQMQSQMQSLPMFNPMQQNLFSLGQFQQVQMPQVFNQSYGLPPGNMFVPPHMQMQNMQHMPQMQQMQQMHQMQMQMPQAAAAPAAVAKEPKKQSGSRRRNGVPLRGGASSKYRGVYWNKNCSAWRARIWCFGKSEHLGNFDDEKEAARAFDKRAAELGRTNALNFPNETIAKTFASRRSSSNSDTTSVGSPGDAEEQAKNKRKADQALPTVAEKDSPKRSKGEETPAPAKEQQDQEEKVEKQEKEEEEKPRVEQAEETKPVETSAEPAKKED